MTRHCRSGVFGLAVFLCFSSLVMSSPALAVSRQPEQTASSPSAKDLDVVTVQLLWVHQFEFAGFYAALEKGYYREEGLDVRLKEAAPGLSVVNEVVSGRADYGVGNADLLVSWAQGQPVVLLANLFKHSPLVILTRQDSGIRQPRDLIGKILMTQEADLDSAEINYMLYQEKMRPGQMILKPHTYRVEELITGQVDAMTAYITNQPYALQEAGVDIRVIDPANYGADFYSNNLFTSVHEAQDHPDRVVAFRRATLKGWRYALDHPAEIIDLIYRQYSQNKTPQALHYEAREIAKLIAEDVYPLGSVDVRRLERLQEVYLRSGVLKTSHANLEPFIWRAAQQTAQRPLLTPAEERFVIQHPEVRLCSSPGWLPYEGIEKGQGIGIAPDVISALIRAVGLRVKEEVYPNWYDALNALKTQNCDLLAGVVASEGRQPFIDFTPSYLDVSNAIVTRKSQAFISDIAELSGKTLGVLAGGVHEELLIRFYPDIRLQSFSSMELGLAALSSGKVDAFIDAVATSGYYIRRSGLENLHIAGLFPHKTPLSIGVRSDWPELLTLMEKSLGAMPEHQMNSIIRHWIGVTASPEPDYRLMWRAALLMLALLGAFLLFYYRLRRANQKLAGEVEQRRRAEESALSLNDELLLKNRQLEALSKTDVLTGLRNRYHIESTLEEAVFKCRARHMPLSILLLDMDHFKDVNDHFGHNTGDLVLQQLAAILMQEQDDHLYAGRWGGEEFLIVLPEQALPSAHLVAEQIREKVEASAFDTVGSLTVSIGVAEMNAADSLSQLINRADQMLYRAKSQGRNCVASASAKAALATGF